MNKYFFFLFFISGILLVVSHYMRYLRILYIIILLIFIVLGVGGGGVANDADKRLIIYKKYEAENNLELLRKTTKDSQLLIDLDSFKNSEEFESYIKKIDENLFYTEFIIKALISVITVIYVMNFLYSFSSKI